MKKSILKSIEPQTKTLFRFKNSDVKTKFFGGVNAGETSTTSNTDPTTTTTITVTW